MTRPLAAALALAVLAALAPRARADDAADRCLAAPVEGQRLQRAGKLLDARARFAECASVACPAAIVDDCTRWAREVDDALPSIVLAARDGQNKDLVDVRVSIDDAPAAPIGARAVAVDPGEHRVVFHRAGSADVAQRVLVREGEKNRAVTATFLAPRAAPPARPGPPPPAAPAPDAARRPVPPAAWVLGGVGVVGLAGFGVLGALGVSERTSRACDVGCDASAKSSVDTKLLAADVSLAVGVVALAAATWVYLARPAVAGSARVTGRNPGDRWPLRVVW